LEKNYLRQRKENILSILYVQIVFISFIYLVQLLGLEDSREVVYGTLDAWVAFEQDFPLAPLRQALLALEKEEQWHRIVQVLYSKLLSTVFVFYAFLSIFRLMTYSGDKMDAKQRARKHNGNI